MKIRINVTAKDIREVLATKDLHSYNALNSCAVARAARRKKGYENITVGISFFHLKNSNNTIIKLPDAVRNNIIEICKGNSVKPFSFTLEIPDA